MFLDVELKASEIVFSSSSEMVFGDGANLIIDQSSSDKCLGATSGRNIFSQNKCLYLNFYNFLKHLNFKINQLLTIIIYKC